LSQHRYPSEVRSKSGRSSTNAIDTIAPLLPTTRPSAPTVAATNRGLDRGRAMAVARRGKRCRSPKRRRGCSLSVVRPGIVVTTQQNLRVVPQHVRRNYSTSAPIRIIAAAEAVLRPLAGVSPGPGCRVAYRSQRATPIALQRVRRCTRRRWGRRGVRCRRGTTKTLGGSPARGTAGDLGRLGWTR
jgi:hypothetical protein